MKPPFPGGSHRIIFLLWKEYSGDRKYRCQEDHHRTDCRKVLLKFVVDKFAHQVVAAGQFDEEVKDERQTDRVDDLCDQRNLEEVDTGQRHEEGRDQQLRNVKNVECLAFLERVIQASGEAKELCKGVGSRE